MLFLAKTPKNICCFQNQHAVFKSLSIRAVQKVCAMRGYLSLLYLCLLPLFWENIQSTLN